MVKYEVVFKKSVTKDLRKIEKHDIEKIVEKINYISETPRGEGCVKLTNIELYRVRSGMYRILYEINDNQLIVHVIKISHRSDAYTN